MPLPCRSRAAPVTQSASGSAARTPTPLRRRSPVARPVRPANQRRPARPQFLAQLPLQARRPAPQADGRDSRASMCRTWVQARCRRTSASSRLRRRSSSRRRTASQGSSAGGQGQAVVVEQFDFHDQQPLLQPEPGQGVRNLVQVRQRAPPLGDQGQGLAVVRRVVGRRLNRDQVRVDPRGGCGAPTSPPLPSAGPAPTAPARDLSCCSTRSMASSRQPLQSFSSVSSTPTRAASCSHRPGPRLHPLLLLLLSPPAPLVRLRPPPPVAHDTAGSAP